MKKQKNLLQSATGPVTTPMTNDSLLQMKEEQVKSVVITNPIVLGKAIDDKDFFLDIRLVLNNHTCINLEMQVINEHNWPERSLSYLCRSFNNLNKGMNYRDVKAAIHIGLLDFTLFSEHPDFYATYQFLNKITGGYYKMLAQNDKYINKASETIYQLTREEKIRLNAKLERIFTVDNTPTKPECQS